MQPQASPDVCDDNGTSGVSDAKPFSDAFNRFDCNTERIIRAADAFDEMCGEDEEAEASLRRAMDAADAAAKAASMALAAWSIAKEACERAEFSVSLAKAAEPVLAKKTQGEDRRISQRKLNANAAEFLKLNKVGSSLLFVFLSFVRSYFLSFFFSFFRWEGWSNGTTWTSEAKTKFGRWWSSRKSTRKRSTCKFLCFCLLWLTSTVCFADRWVDEMKEGGRKGVGRKYDHTVQGTNWRPQQLEEVKEVKQEPKKKKVKREEAGEEEKREKKRQRAEKNLRSWGSFLKDFR
jgi:hypothetical protein